MFIDSFFDVFVDFDGGLGTDNLGIKGNGSPIVSKPAGSTQITDPKSGKVNIGAVVDAVVYAGVEPLDIDGGGGPVTIAPTGLADVLNVTAGVNLTGAIVPVGTQQALVISGTTGGGFFESHAVWNASTLTIDTVSGGTDGSDSVTFTSANNAHLITNITVAVVLWAPTA